MAFIRRTILGLESRLTLVDADEEFSPGFRLLPAVGHRHDHVVLTIASDDAQLLHLADAAIHPIFVEHRDWVSTFDSMPDKALAARERLLDRAASAGSRVFGVHFPFPGLGYVRHGEKGWKWMPLPTTGGTNHKEGVA